MERTEKLANAMSQMDYAVGVMIDTIIECAEESEDGELTYEETIDEGCGYTETRTILPDGTILDEDGHKITTLDDMSANQIYEICAQLI